MYLALLEMNHAFDNAVASAGDREMHNAFRYDRRRQKWEDSRKDPEAAKAKAKSRQR
jgi:hypothetical protein